MSKEQSCSEGACDPPLGHCTSTFDPEQEKSAGEKPKTKLRPRALCLLWLVLLAAPFSWAHQRASQPVMGVSESYEVPVPQVNPEPPKIDGVLDEPAWKQAVRLSGFYTFDLQRGAKPAHETAVLVLASPSALYFGFECAISNPKRLHITETRRDADVQRDERVVVLLDTLHSHERFYILNGQKFVPFAI